MKKIINLVVLAMLVSFSTSLKAQTSGTMSFTFTTPKHTTGNYVSDGRYVLAVWIESCATCGAGTTAGVSTFVKTNLRYWAGGTNDHLPTWNSKSAASVVGAAATGATQTTFTARTVTWDGKNAAGTTLLADGNYRVCIQETWGHGTATATRYFPFVKGATAFTNTTDVAADTNFTGISLTWSPTLANETFVSGPEVVVYPNPSKGIFNLDLKSQVKNITVVNTLGALIYEENINDSSIVTTKTIDLSQYTNGVYFINVSDDNGSSCYKVVLDK